jgi:hypothetical protein
MRLRPGPRSPGQTGFEFSGFTPPFFGIACTTASDCVLVGGTAANAVAYTTGDAGQRWTKSAMQ